MTEETPLTPEELGAAINQDMYDQILLMQTGPGSLWTASPHMRKTAIEDMLKRRQNREIRQIVEPIPKGLFFDEWLSFKLSLKDDEDKRNDQPRKE